MSNLLIENIFSKLYFSFKIELYYK